MQILNTFETYFYLILLILIIHENSKSLFLAVIHGFRDLAQNGRPSVRQTLYMAPTCIGETEPKSKATPCRQPMNFLHLNIWIFKAHCIFDDYCTLKTFTGKRCGASLTKAIELHCKCDFWTSATVQWHSQFEPLCQCLVVDVDTFDPWTPGTDSRDKG